MAERGLERKMWWKEGKRCGASGTERKFGERERGLKIIFRKFVSMNASFHKTCGNKKKTHCLSYSEVELGHSLGPRQVLVKAVPTQSTHLYLGPPLWSRDAPTFKPLKIINLTHSW